MITVYSNNLTKREMLGLAEEILKTIRLKQEHGSNKPYVILVSEAIRFIISHYEVNDQLVPLVVDFLRKPKNIIGACLMRLKDPFYTHDDFIQTFGFVDRFLSEFRNAMYLYPQLKGKLANSLSKLTDQIWQDTFTIPLKKDGPKWPRRKIKISSSGAGSEAILNGQAKD